MLILCLGFLGTGRSNIATLLARALRYDFIEMEGEVLSRTGQSDTITAMENYLDVWKTKEVEVAKELSEKDNSVIACHDGIIDNSLNIDYFKEKTGRSKFIYLQAHPSELTSRLIKFYRAFDRPSLQNVLRKMEKINHSRNILYEQCADLTIETGDYTPEEACEDILMRLGLKTNIPYSLA